MPPHHTTFRGVMKNIVLKASQLPFLLSVSGQSIYMRSLSSSIIITESSKDLFKPTINNTILNLYRYPSNVFSSSLHQNKNIFSPFIEQTYINRRLPFKNAIRLYSIKHRHSSYSGSDNHATPLSSSPPECPEIIPTIPIIMRPLIPGYYKTLSIMDSKISSQIQELVQKARKKTPAQFPVIGVFLSRIYPPERNTELQHSPTHSADDQIITSNDQSFLKEEISITNEEEKTSSSNEDNENSHWNLEPKDHINSKILQINSIDEIYQTGTLCSIINMVTNSDGMLTLVVYPHYRIQAIGCEPSPCYKTVSQDPLTPYVSSSVTQQASDIIHEELSIETMDNNLPCKLETNEIPDEGESNLTFSNKKILPTHHSLAWLRVEKSNFSFFQNPSIGSSKVIHALVQECLAILANIAKMNSFIREHLSSMTTPLPSVNEPTALADLIAVLCSGPSSSLQTILDSPSLEKRLKTALELLLREQEASQLQMTLRRSIEEKISSKHREALLMEQMKAIQKELGGSSSHQGTGESLKEKAIAMFQARLAPLRVFLDTRKELASGMESSPLTKLPMDHIVPQPSLNTTIPQQSIQGQSSGGGLEQRVQNVINIADEELNRLVGVEPSSGEFGIIRTYLDWLTSLPWISSSPGQSKPMLTLHEARMILDADHYGLMDVKQRILEMLAVTHLRQMKEESISSSTSQSFIKEISVNNTVSTSGHSHHNPRFMPGFTIPTGSFKTDPPPSILLLVGPPGIGKSSIGASVARALGRPFFRFSLGGLTDVAEIKGHRRTYLGAMPGKFIQALKQTQSLSPVVLLDEIDKITGNGGGYGHHRQGDPSSALLEALDNGGGSGFLDHFLDTPVDLSRAFFIATANTTETIPAPLLDRMSVVNLTSYTTQEKLVIARRHILPQAISIAGLCPLRDNGDISSDLFNNTLYTNVNTIPGPNSIAVEHLPQVNPRTLGISLPENTLRALIEGWCREPGVRQLRQSIERICRRVAAASLEHDSDQFMFCKALGPGVTIHSDFRGDAYKLYASSDTGNVSLSCVQNDNPSNSLKENRSKSDQHYFLPMIVNMTPEALPHLLGLPPFSSDRIWDPMVTYPPGVVAGLAWTPYGGSVLHVEVAALSGRPITGDLSGSLKTTGHLGKVMEESAAIAQSVARSYLLLSEGDTKSFITKRSSNGDHSSQKQNSLKDQDYLGDKSLETVNSSKRSFDLNSNGSFEEKGHCIGNILQETKSQIDGVKGPELHLHVPEGATPKDGPSAGIAMAAAMVSLAKGIPVRNGLGFTGELTLSGRVLRIGGLKEKALAARREGLSGVIFPMGNISEWKELEQMTPEPLVGDTVGLLGYPVLTFSQVIDVCFTDNPNHSSLSP